MYDAIFSVHGARNRMHVHNLHSRIYACIYIARSCNCRRNARHTEGMLLHAFMYVCMYVCMYVRMYVCMCVCVYVYAYVCMYV